MLLDFIDKQSDILKKIQGILSFTEVYQDLGLHVPVWLSVKEQVDQAVRNADLGNIELDMECRDLEIFADRMLQRAFGNLLENAVRHGKKVTRIRLSCVEAKDELKLIWQDDGEGIPEDKKEKVSPSEGSVQKRI